MRQVCAPAALVMCAALAGCGDESEEEISRACDAEAEIMTTSEGVDFVRTPDSCFDSLPEWPYEAQYAEIDGLRQAYVDEGPTDGPVVLLLHGQPSWSYLYRTMIPVLADAGYRVIAMDHLGMGRSDKPIDIASYSYLGHGDRLLRFIEQLELRDINLFVQDWGSQIGLRVVGLNPDLFARVAVGNGSIQVTPADFTPFPDVENPDEIVDLVSPFAGSPDQQVPFYDGCERLGGIDGAEVGGGFGAWMEYAMKGESFHPAEVLEALTWFPMSAEAEAAYDAPFPSRTYMAGVRIFPSLVNEMPGLNDEAWAGLTSFTKPFLTLWAANDPGMQGTCEAQQNLVQSIPGALGQPHDRLAEASHFLQDDQGAEIAQRLVPFFASNGGLPSDYSGFRYCEILIGELVGTQIEFEVWGTPGLNDCPAESWEALDAETIKSETGAYEVVMNGPRHWLSLATSSSQPSQELRTFGDLETRLMATLSTEVDEPETPPYSEQPVLRTTTYLYLGGSEIYELTAPDGAVFVMLSMSMIVDPDLTLADLPTLGERLAL
ncbi:MAG: haloalkane dehalogenase, partial [Myxococcota bacterium]